MWKTIEEYPNYEINTDSTIRRIKSKRILKQDGTSPYFRVTLWIKNIPKHQSVHRLMAKAFIPNPENKAQVNHIDGNKKNNNIENLEWATISENSKHAFDLNLRTGRPGEKNSNSVLTMKAVLDIIEQRKNNVPCCVLAKKYGVSANHISRVASGKRWVTALAER